jgi:hypothetical protein
MCLLPPGSGNVRETVAIDATFFAHGDVQTR